MAKQLNTSIKMLQVSQNEIDILNMEYGLFTEHVKPCLSEFEMKRLKQEMLSEAAQAEEAYLTAKQNKNYSRSLHKEYTLKRRMYECLHHAYMFSESTLKILSYMGEKRIKQEDMTGYIILGWAKYCQSVMNAKKKKNHPDFEVYLAILFHNHFIQAKHSNQFLQLPIWQGGSYRHIPYSQFSKRFLTKTTLIPGTTNINC